VVSDSTIGTVGLQRLSFDNRQPFVRTHLHEQYGKAGVITEDVTPRRRSLSLSTKTLVGAALGLGCGLFFGELCGHLKIVGDAFIGLLQMTVLPYIMVTLIASIGRLTLGQAGRIAGRAMLIILLLWGVAMLAVVLISSTYPPRQSAAFFDFGMLTPPESIDLVELFIPANPFQSLASNAIPAVVLFCVGVGISLMRISNRAVLLTQLDAWVEVFTRLNGLMVKLTPYGVWAIVANAAGTMTVAEFSQLQAYLLSYTAAVIVIGFFVLPALVTACTPFRYRDLLDVTLQAMITAFATGRLLIVLPQLAERTRELFAQYGEDNEETRADVEMIYPLIYPIPNLGKLLTLSFVPFVAWFAGSPLSSSDYPSLLLMGSVTYFSKPVAALPFLLDTFQLPIDMFQMFLVSEVYCGRSGDLLAVMHLFAVTVLATCWSRGMLTVSFSRLAVRLGISLGAACLMVVALQNYLVWSTGEMSSIESVVTEMQNLRHPSPAVVRTEVTEPSPPVDDLGDGLIRVRDTGVLRVGYIKDNLPYSYFNASGELVGLDVDMAHMLAEEIGCTLEFIPFRYPNLAAHLEAGDFDVAMAGIPVTTEHLLRMNFSEPYVTASWSFVVPDHRRREFSVVSEILQMEDLSIAIPRGAYFVNRTRRALVDAELIQVDSPQEFFDAPEGTYDVMLMDAEGGSAWTFLHPGYQVVVPQPGVIQQPLAYAVRLSDNNLAEFLNQWLRLKITGGEFKQLYQHWILGRPPKSRQRRWSVLDNIIRKSD